MLHRNKDKSDIRFLTANNAREKAVERTFKVLKGKIIISLYPTEVSFKKKLKIKPFSDIKKVKEFIASRPKL